MSESARSRGGVDLLLGGGKGGRIGRTRMGSTFYLVFRGRRPFVSHDKERDYSHVLADFPCCEE